MRISSSVFCMLSVCSWLFWFNTPATGQTVTLPVTTTNYYTVVSTAFGGLNSSYSYHEYGTTTLQRWWTIGRYYAPDTTEYTDVNGNAYYLWLPPLPGQNPNCTTSVLSAAQQNLWGGANAFLVNLTNEQVQFSGPVTATVRSQMTYHYTYSTSYEVDNEGDPAANTSINTFLQLAYATAGVSNSRPYSVNVTIDVYFLADSNGLIMTGNGATPQEFTLTGWRLDKNTGKNLTLNFVQDFMLWAQLDTADRTKPSSACLNPTNTNPPVLPTIPKTPMLGKIPQGSLPVPTWTGGRAYVEITSSDTTYPFLQVYSFVDLNSYKTNPGIGQEIATVVNNTTTFVWDNYLYVYTPASAAAGIYDTGAIYKIIDDIIVPEINQFRPQTTCENGSISAGHFSPLQWLNGGSLLTIFQNTGFLSNAAFMNNPQVVRGYTADWWHASNLSNYCNRTKTNYTFNLDIYAVQTPASNWTNLGRTLLNNSSPNWPQQLLRLNYTGNASGTIYSLLMDFFVQHPEPFLNDTTVLDPATYFCYGGSQNIQDTRKNVAMSVGSLSFEPINVNDKLQSSVQSVSSVPVSSGPSVGSFGLGISIFVASMATAVGVAKFGTRKWNFPTALGKYFSPVEQQKKTQ